MGGPGGRQRTRAGSLPACSSDADPGELTGIVTPKWVNSKKCPRGDLNTATGEISVSCSPGWLWMTSQVLAGTRSGPQR